MSADRIASIATVVSANPEIARLFALWRGATGTTDCKDSDRNKHATGFAMVLSGFIGPLMTEQGSAFLRHPREPFKDVFRDQSWLEPESLTMLSGCMTPEGFDELLLHVLDWFSGSNFEQAIANTNTRLIARWKLTTGSRIVHVKGFNVLKEPVFCAQMQDIPSTLAGLKKASVLRAKREFEREEAKKRAAEDLKAQQRLAEEMSQLAELQVNLAMPDFGTW